MPMMDVTVRFEPFDAPAACCDADLRGRCPPGGRVPLERGADAVRGVAVIDRGGAGEVDAVAPDEADSC